MALIYALCDMANLLFLYSPQKYILDYFLTILLEIISCNKTIRNERINGPCHALGSKVMIAHSPYFEFLP